MTGVNRKKLDQEFQEYYLTSSLPSMRAGLIITFILFVGFAVSNRIIFGYSSEQVYFLRFGIIVPYILISLLATFLNSWRPYLHQIFTWINLFLAIGVFIIGITSNPHEPGYEYFFSWVMLVIVGTYTFYRIRFWSLVSIGGLQLLSYLLATILNQSYLTDLYRFINNLFFVISISSLGFFIAFILQRINQKDFLHQKALSDQYQKLIEENKERRKAEEALSHSEKMYHTILEAIPDWIYLLNSDMQVVYINPALTGRLEDIGISNRKDFPSIASLAPFVSTELKEEINKVFDSKTPAFLQEKYSTGEKMVYTDTSVIPILSGGNASQVLVILRDRSKEKEVEELKQRNTEQKEIMLREIHHRVKNNLAIVISLLGLQYNNNPSPELKKIIRDIELRIRSMALIHEHLYRSENIDRIPLDSYLSSLSEIIRSSYSGNPVQMVMKMEPMSASIETALPLGLIANELLTNAFKYAFGERTDGKITITLSRKEIGFSALSISDNGIGLPEGFTLENQSSLGMFIIRLLSEQLDGRNKFSRDNGTTFTVLFSDQNKVSIRTDKS